LILSIPLSSAASSSRGGENRVPLSFIERIVRVFSYILKKYSESRMDVTKNYRKLQDKKRIKI